MKTTDGYKLIPGYDTNIDRKEFDQMVNEAMEEIASMESLKPMDLYSPDITLREYQEAAKETAIYPIAHSITYPMLLLSAEVGEAANKYQKHIRGDGPLDKKGIFMELGDILWAMSALATDLGVSLEDVARANLKKLSDRKAKGTIKGSGDER